MRAAQLEKVVGRYMAATRYAVTHIRDSNGSCSLCRAMRGQQHLKSCQLWPLISARIDHHLAEEAPPPETVVLHDSTGHFYRRRRA